MISETSVPMPEENPAALAEAVGIGPALRRRLSMLAVVALAFLAALAATFAWRQYDAARSRSLHEVQARVILAASIFDTYFAGQISTLEGIAKSPTVVSADQPGMRAYFERLQSKGAPLFTGGIGWIDRTGISRVSSNPASRTGLNVSDRSYFKQVVATRKPYVSEGLVARRDHRRIIVMAVPSLDAQGHFSGVVAGSLELRQSNNNRSSIDLGYQGLAVLDRKGDNIVLASLAHPTDAALLVRFHRDGRGVLTNVRGLDGSGGRVVAFASSSLPAWTTVIDRPQSAVFAAATHSFILELASIGAGALLVLILILWATRQTRRGVEATRAEVRSWTELTRALGSAGTASDVSDALLVALTARFAPRTAIVALEGPEGPGLTIWAARGHPFSEAMREQRPDLVAPLSEAYESSRTTTARVSPTQRSADGGSLTLYAAPLSTRDEPPLGAIMLLFTGDRALDDSDKAIIAAHADQAAQALARTRAHEREHDAAVTLQRSLLPDRLPTVEGIEIAGRYRPGGEGLEVGGDWYDVIRRPDGIVHMTVGDVAGHGIAAAARMGELRSAFRAYAYEHTSPAEITRRLSRHAMGDDAMATVVCLTLDPYTGELRSSSAGHPPVVLVEPAVAECRLLGAGAPPLGVAPNGQMPEEELLVPVGSTLIAYTDGLVERRDADIDAGISRLIGLGTSFASSSAEAIAHTILTENPAPLRSADDVALLVVKVVEIPECMVVEIPAEPSALEDLRTRAQTWLARLELADDHATAVLAAIELGGDDGRPVEVKIDTSGGTVSALVDGRERRAAAV